MLQWFGCDMGARVHTVLQLQNSEGKRPQCGTAHSSVHTVAPGNARPLLLSLCNTHTLTKSPYCMHATCQQPVLLTQMDTTGTTAPAESAFYTHQWPFNHQVMIAVYGTYAHRRRPSNDLLWGQRFGFDDFCANTQHRRLPAATGGTNMSGPYITHTT